MVGDWVFGGEHLVSVHRVKLYCHTHDSYIVLQTSYLNKNE